MRRLNTVWYRQGNEEILGLYIPVHVVSLDCEGKEENWTSASKKRYRYSLFGTDTPLLTAGSVVLFSLTIFILHYSILERFIPVLWFSLTSSRVYIHDLMHLQEF
jgi:hypothetical protein